MGPWALRKVTVETLGGPRTQSEMYRTTECPDDLLIDGAVPDNWRQHRAALMLEAKAIRGEQEQALLELLAGGDPGAIQGSALVGVSDVEKDSKRHNKIKGLQARLRGKRTRGR